MSGSNGGSRSVAFLLCCAQEPDWAKKRGFRLWKPIFGGLILPSDSGQRRKMAAYSLAGSREPRLAQFMATVATPDKNLRNVHVRPAKVDAIHRVAAVS